MPSMTKRERLAATLRGEPVDRPAWSLWRHFYAEETTAKGLADAMLGFQKVGNFDFMKVNARASYHMEDWGLKLRFSGHDQVKPVVLDYPVKKPADLALIQPLDVQKGALGEHLEALSLIGEGLRGEVPYIMTVFTPLSILGDMVEDDSQLKRYMDENPAAVHAALDAVTTTFAGFASACVQHGASGLFFATTSWASERTITKAQYDEFGRPYDLRILDAMRDAELNVLHVCDEQNMLLDLVDYPVHGFNWAVNSRGNPSFAQVAAKTDKMLIGGLARDSLVGSSSDTATEQSRSAQTAASGLRWVLGPDCSIETRSSDQNIAEVRRLIGA